MKNINKNCIGCEHNNWIFCINCEYSNYLGINRYSIKMFLEVKIDNSILKTTSTELFYGKSPIDAINCAVSRNKSEIVWAEITN